MHDALTSLVLILLLGISAQWLAWRLKIPAIILLLAFGIAAGPVFHIIDPDGLVGPLLFPLVSLAVAVILFEGGLSLRPAELAGIGKVVWRLCSVGALVTWVLAGIGAHILLGLSVPLSALLGAILVVTGPTVIIPLLRQLKLAKTVSSVLRWEGILIDPIGAILAVLVFEVLLSGAGASDTAHALAGFGQSALVGTAVGLAGAFFLSIALGRYYLPDYLQNSIVLMTVGAVLVVANELRDESGILAVTIMGVALATQSSLPLRNILEFKENLRVLLISSLFIVLAARLDLGSLADVVAPGLVYLAFLVAIVRPISVVIASIGTGLTWPERFMLMAMAPRGIVAASVVSVFSLGLAETNLAGSEQLVPLTFLVIIGTILFYSLVAPLIARLTGLARDSAEGILFLGAHPWARSLASILRDEGITVQMVDDNYTSIRKAAMTNLSTYYGSPLSERLDDHVDLGGIGNVMALTPNDEANSLASVHLAEQFDRSSIYQLAPEESGTQKESEPRPVHLRGRILFRPDASYTEISRRIASGAVIKRTSLTDEFGMDQYFERYGDDALPLLLIEDGSVQIFAADNPPKPKAGQKIVGLVVERPGAEAKNNGDALGDS